MGVLLGAVAGAVLGLGVFAGLLALLVGVNFTQRLDDAEVYSRALSDSGAYTRIYDEVLVDEALRERTGRLLGNIEVEVHDEAVDALREVLPPEYLREQVEANIDRLTAYLRYERDDLDIHVLLEDPLERIEPAMVGRVHRYVDELDFVEPESSTCSLETLQHLAAASAEPYSRLSQGQLPRSAPSLGILSRECREKHFVQWFDLLLENPAIRAQAARILGDEIEELRRSFLEGDTRGFIKAAASPLVEPVIESAVSDVRDQLPPDGRIDLLEWLTGQPGSPSRADVEAQAESLRDALHTANGPMRNFALAAVILGSLLLALVHLPRPSLMLGWPGVALLAGGGVCVIAGFVVNSVMPDLARNAVENAFPGSGGVPIPAIALAGDLVESLTSRATGGFVPAAAAVMTVGGVLIVASMYCGRLSTLVRRLMPGSGDCVRNRQI